MKSFAAFEVKNRFSELLATVEQGQRVSDAIKRLRELGSGAVLGCTVQKAIQEGRD